MRSPRNSAKLLGALVALSWFTACSDNPGGPSAVIASLPDGVMVSNPVPAAALGGEARAALALASGAGTDVVYVSLAPGTVPAGSQAIVRRVGDTASLTTTVAAGGFDPVPVVAQAGDSVDVAVTDARADTVYHVRAAVLAARPPVIVRTEPPPRKRDVPLNASVVIVFSEPVEGRTLNSSSVQVLSGTTPVGGTVSLLQGSATAAVFTPDAALDANTDYRLVVTQAVRDLGGDALGAGVTVEFTTGSALVGPVASVRVEPDSLDLLVGSQFQLTATAQDSLGIPVIGRPITWTSGDPSVAEVSMTGLVTALGNGYALIEAKIDGQTGGLPMSVSGVRIGFVTLTPESARVAVGYTLQLVTGIRDTAGAIVFLARPITWTSSDAAVATVAPSYSQTGIVTGVSAGSAKISATVDGKSDTAVVTVVAGPGTVEISPTSASVPASDTIMLTATVRDAAGNPLDHPSVTWTSSTLGVATVAADSAGSSGLAFATVTGVSPGSATITATSGTASGTASVTVTSPRPIASVTVTPGAASLVAQGTVALSATLRDAQGTLIERRTISWASDNTAVATVDTSGLVTGVGVGAASVSAMSDGVSGTGAITVIMFESVSAGSYYYYFRRNIKFASPIVDVRVRTCGVTTAGAAYCWGHPVLGNGSTTNSPVPAAVTGGLTFSTVTVGVDHSCGLTTDGAAYCWGGNGLGQLGDGSTITNGTYSLVPVAVTGGLTFSTITAGNGHTCGLTTAGIAHCWGSNGSGQLGDGSTSSSSVPVAVTSGLMFAKVTAGSSHTCGLTTDGAAYCWGWNGAGQLGDGSTTSSSVPVAVTGGLSFSALSAAEAYTCGLATDGAAYCWGLNSSGQLGDGSTSSSSVPVPVAGGITFSTLAAGVGRTVGIERSHTCGVATAGTAYCWGSNSSGELGDGSTSSSPVPVSVAGGLTFSTLSASGMHTCGVATNGAAYCWGDNSDGQLGTGTTISSDVPVKVLGPP